MPCWYLTCRTCCFSGSKGSENSHLRGEGTMPCPAMVTLSIHHLRLSHCYFSTKCLWKQNHMPCSKPEQRPSGEDMTACCSYHIFLISLFLSHLAKTFTGIDSNSGQWTGLCRWWRVTSPMRSRLEESPKYKTNCTGPHQSFHPTRPTFILCKWPDQLLHSC